MEMLIGLVGALWPIIVGIIGLVVVLAQAHYRVQNLEEKVKILFDFHNARKKE